MTEEPLISVLMTAFNREQYIAEAIDSILASTYKNFELIIVDDCSKDKTIEIVRRYAGKDRRIRFYENERNLGDYPNRNRAASYARGKYIKYCDSDDLLFDWSLAYCVNMMEKYPTAGMGILNHNKETLVDYLPPKAAIETNFFERAILYVGPSGTVMKRDAFEKIGCYNTNYGAASDMYFNLKMASSFPIVLLGKEFFFYRVHDGQEFTNNYSYVCYNYKYLYDAFQLPGFPLTEKQKHKFLKIARHSFSRSLLKYLGETGEIRKTMKALQVSGVGLGGFVRGILP